MFTHGVKKYSIGSFNLLGIKPNLYQIIYMIGGTS